MKYVDCSKLQILQVMQTREENVNTLTCFRLWLCWKCICTKSSCSN